MCVCMSECAGSMFFSLLPVRVLQNEQTITTAQNDQ